MGLHLHNWANSLHAQGCPVVLPFEWSGASQGPGSHTVEAAEMPGNQLNLHQTNSNQQRKDVREAKSKTYRPALLPAALRPASPQASWRSPAQPCRTPARRPTVSLRCLPEELSAGTPQGLPTSLFSLLCLSSIAALSSDFPLKWPILYSSPQVLLSILRNWMKKIIYVQCSALLWRIWSCQNSVCTWRHGGWHKHTHTPYTAGEFFLM